MLPFCFFLFGSLLLEPVFVLPLQFGSFRIGRFRSEREIQREVLIQPFERIHKVAPKYVPDESDRVTTFVANEAVKVIVVQQKVPVRAVVDGAWYPIVNRLDFGQVHLYYARNRNLGLDYGSIVDVIMFA